MSTVWLWYFSQLVLSMKEGMDAYAFLTVSCSGFFWVGVRKERWSFRLSMQERCVGAFDDGKRGGGYTYRDCVSCIRDVLYLCLHEMEEHESIEEVSCFLSDMVFRSRGGASVVRAFGMFILC